MQVASKFQAFPTSQIRGGHVRPVEIPGTPRQWDHAPLTFPGDAELVVNPTGVWAPHADDRIGLQLADQAVVGMPVVDLFVPSRFGSVEKHLGDRTVLCAQFPQLL